MKGTRRIPKTRCRPSRFVRRNSSTIMAIGGCVGLIATVIFAARATPTAMELLEEAEELKQEPLTKTEIVTVVTPVYLPAAMTGIFTLSLFLGADILNRRQKASMIGAYAALQKTYKEHREKVKELFGEDADAVVRRAIAKDKLQNCDTSDMKEDECWFVIPEFDIEFKSTQQQIVLGEYHFNRNYALRGYADVKELREFLDAPSIEGESYMGWSAEAGIVYGYNWIDFEHELVGKKDGIELWHIWLPFPPTTDYMEVEWY